MRARARPLFLRTVFQILFPISQTSGTKGNPFFRFRVRLQIRNTVEALLTDTLVTGKLYFRPPSQNTVFLKSHTNSVFLHFRKRPAPVTDI